MTVEEMRKAMALNEHTKRQLFALAIEALHHDRTVDDEVQLDSQGFRYIKVRAFSPEVSVDMKINISPCLAAQLGLAVAYNKREEVIEP